MPFELTTPPGIEPVTLAEAKAHLRVEHTADDSVIPEIITAARSWIEDLTATALITQTWRMSIDAWPETSVTLAPTPVQSVSSVKIFATDGTATTLATAAYDLLSVGRSARLIRTSGAVWPAPTRAQGGVEITFVAGYGAAASDVPRPLRQALLMCVAHLYENRELVGEGAPLPMGVEALLAPFRTPRL